LKRDIWIKVAPRRKHCRVADAPLSRGLGADAAAPGIFEWEMDLPLEVGGELCPSAQSLQEQLSSGMMV